VTDTEVKKLLLTASDNELGNFGERLWSRVFESSSVNYIPLSQISNGGAPKIQCKGNGTVLPDFDVACGRWTAYIDSKCKTQSVLFRKKNQVRHGIDRRIWAEYQKAGLTYRKECAIAVLELLDHEGKWSGEIMIETLRELGEPFAGESNQRHMVYWPKKAFRNLHSFTPCELWNAYKGVGVPSFAPELDLVFNRKSQGGLF